ncbi:translocation and assembly module lipoprotein TamL [Edaphocola flava]|uniref:translocation and assembly module lipoprotein TamL n=1 Tax=Edaphocola flava TaxID=2499629 RepID=UPI00100AEF0C|nr:BamA/TamA family outer membrane protein [Edaphocola flava]
MKKTIHILTGLMTLCWLMLMASSCSNTRYLAKGQTLYLGSKVKVTDTASKDKGYLEEVLGDAIRPKPNKRIFGIRFKLTMYNWAGEPRSEKGLRKYIRDKIGEAPVLGESFNLKRNEQILLNKLQNNGYFYPVIVSRREDDTLKKTTKGFFEIQAGKRYFMRNIDYLTGDTTALAAEIRNVADKSLLKKGNPYLLDAVMADRDRIDDYLKNMGYYYFSPDYLIAKVDTGTNTDSIDVHMQLKSDLMPPKTFQQYRIKDIYVNTNYIARSNTDSTAANRRRNMDTIPYEHYSVIQRRENFRPVLFKTAIQQKPGDLYSKRKQNLTLNRLVSLNAFKFIKSELTDTYDSTGLPLLTALYNLTPAPSKALSFETSAFSQNDSRVGSRLSVGWKHRNIFKGAEQLEIKLSGGFEMQYGGAQKRPNLFQAGLETNLSVPRLLFGSLFKVSTTSAFVPRSYVKLGYNYYLSETTYRLNTFNFGLGYQWRESINKEHKLYPVNITFVRTDTFKNASDFYISNIIFNGVIIGSTYQFTYNSQIAGRKDVNFFFDGLLDLSGNILGLAQKTSLSKEPEKIFGNPYAQYVKVQTDFRVYKTFGKENMWANRLFLGAGYAYGNSYKMPNIKQFFAGGASSLRGFRSRFLGPGSFHTSKSTTNFLELLGDIKMEANTEFRTPLYSTWLKGAVFADAGNIWLLRDDPTMPGGVFSKNFISDIAVSGGLGLRFDFSILVLRLDFGMPLRKPWMDPGEKWVINRIDFSSKAWRQENIVFNLAIGYPF